MSSAGFHSGGRQRGRGADAEDEELLAIEPKIGDFCGHKEYLGYHNGLSWFIIVYDGLSWFIMVYHGLSWVYNGS